MFLFVGSMYGVVLSADAVTFLVLWEIMSLSSAALVASDYSHRVVQKSAMIYLGATRIATALLCGGFLAMHAVTGSWSFADWTFSSSSSYVAGCLILLAFCIKAGIWPFHIWLPYTHPAAPSTVSALMSGFTIKIAIYGIMRILVCGGLNSPEIINLALFLGAVSTFWGILFALVQNDLKRLLAYSSIENIGMILIAIALGLKAKLAGLEALALVAFVAATFHCMNHGLFKSLLFLCAGTIDTQAHTRDLRRLGGLAKQMPWTAACFLGGSLAICSIPPLNGFASKWLIYQTFFKTTYETSSYLDRGIAFAGICLLSVVGGLTIATFVKAIGVSFLGNARSKSAEIAREAKLGMVVAPLFLLIVCVTLGVGAAQSVPFIAKALVETPGLQSLASPDQLQATVQFPIPMNMIALSLFSMSALIYMFFLKTSRTRKYSTWDCGFGTLSTRTQVSSDSFAQPMARIFRPILKYQAKLKIDGDDCRHFPEKVNVEVQMVSILESRIYLPTLALISHASKYLAKLQAGSIHLYLLYVCITLVVLLLVGVHL
ncbi:MAG: proton-conducting transporter membrane subunit [Candidatus Melainabacteria bacterium]|nr:proton-conducting transporter membrane subunit [Candidatus Melainabacteria bacterium]